MIEYQEGNLTENGAKALVNTVNCVGVMGKGIALSFKKAFPSYFEEYKSMCGENLIHAGHVYVHPTNKLIGPKYLISFATKHHWQNPSKMRWVVNGLKELVILVREFEIKSIAIPALGCGNGGLNWNEVRPLIEFAFSDMPDVHVIIYPPKEWCTT